VWRGGSRGVGKGGGRGGGGMAIPPRWLCSEGSLLLGSRYCGIYSSCAELVALSTFWAIFGLGFGKGYKGRVQIGEATLGYWIYVPSRHMHSFTDCDLVEKDEHPRIFAVARLLVCVLEGQVVSFLCVLAGGGGIACG